MFARLRGIPERHIEEVVATEIERLDLGKHAKKRCATYRFVLRVKQVWWVFSEKIDI